MPKTDVQVKLEDGNVFAIIGQVSRALKGAGLRDLAKEYTNRVFDSASYSEALSITMEYVTIKENS